MTTKSEDMRSSGEARGLRIAYLRNSLNYSQEEFAAKFKVSPHTIHNWEKNKNGGLSEKRAKEVINILKQEGVHCTLAWLLHGIEPIPTFPDPVWNLNVMEELTDPASLISSQEEAEALTKEIKVFRENYPHLTMEIVVKDDGMEPLYQKGQYIIGLKHTGKQIIKLVDQNCIVQTETGELLLRHIRKGSMLDHYHLICTNILTTQIEKPFLYDVKLLAAAPVIWARSKIKKQ